MASANRQELKNWLGNIEIKADRVLDVGGISWPVKGLTKIWEVNDYKILDWVKERRGYTTDIVADINLYCPEMNFDVVFCLEVMPFIYDPVKVIKNIAGFLKKGGLLYITFHQVFVHNKGNDYLRYTRMGIEKYMEIGGFKILDIKPRLYNQSRDGEVGHFVIAQKI